MIVITGGAGMIGSMIARHLNLEGRDDLIIADNCKHPEQWQNLSHRRYADYLDKSELLPWLERGQKINAVIHMGAISATTERDFNLLVQENYRYSQLLWNWCAEHRVPYLYASSAATYGNGELGYDDTTEVLRPINGYGYSKHRFDQWALQQVRSNAPTPPQWCGFKFFNVYGPNEYHKERMASVAFHTFNQVVATGGMKLFRSDQQGVGDGMQSRDFVYVKDAARIVAWFLQHPDKSGIYNIGTGQARTFLDLANTVMTSMGRTPDISWIDMPQDLKGKYQYFTQANISKLRAAGYDQPFHTLEEGVRDYVQNHLMQADAYC